MADDRLKNELIELESRLLDNESRKSSKFLNDLLHEDFLEIGASGRKYNKQQTIGLLIKASQFTSTANGFEYVPLSDNAALISYELTVNRSGLNSQSSVRSSIWVLHNEKWRLIFHQGTNKS